MGLAAGASVQRALAGYGGRRGGFDPVAAGDEVVVVACVQEGGARRGSRAGRTKPPLGRSSPTNSTSLSSSVPNSGYWRVLVVAIRAPREGCLAHSKAASARAW